MMQTGNNRYLYNGKELQQMASLDFLDYGARMYDGYSGRWFNIDPLAEKYLKISLYVYTVNNPVNALDPDGKRTIFVNGYYGGGSSRYKSYWGDGKFIARAQKHYHDYSEPHVTDVDHSAASLPKTRQEAG